ncbi:zinc-finger domain-containing protein [endosymbiont of Ridgeia piscesae]|jgi:uncharacterized Zn-finger protein|uniref:Putative conserved protein, contains Zn-finger domain n=1 Tax=endosymbiont of Ridgeia piscesae TaxID=54398 RepID=A0A0T5Z1S1_9GAMM|nr:zinc-finger domain-containing protein [endosymbiont of Ridgeia piscesae]KRT55683.1 hypothetical protein Ga0074115_12244 [endosymbiont of Ridgeia piscesae]KRT56852.1 putative conserved protein, contains Zn-finger domain [endosymbiont of Ridgeia piscesae]
MSEFNARPVGQEVIKVKRSELPLSCPPQSASLAAMHPRVYLPIEKTGSAVCPYCGASYQLDD